MKKIPMIILSVATAGCIAAGTAAVLSEKQAANVEQGGNSGNLAPAKKIYRVSLLILLQTKSILDKLLHQR